MNSEYLIKSITKPLWRIWYWYVSRIDRKEEVAFLNYGFDNGIKIPLDQRDEVERYPLQLYHHVTESVDLFNKNILEIGCGRGGGASYVARYLKPKMMVAADISRRAISCCRIRHQSANLEFVQADSEKLPWSDSRFDAVINVESSHCYPSISNFFREVYRILKPGGFLLYADFRNVNNIGFLRKAVKESKFKIIIMEDITSQVASALEKDNDRRSDLVKRLMPGLIQRPARDFAGVINSNTFRAFARKINIYYFYVLKKV